VLVDSRIKLDENFKKSFIGEIIKVCDKNNTQLHNNSRLRAILTQLIMLVVYSRCV